MCLTPLSDILNRTGKGFHISSSPSVVSHLVYMDDLKLYGRYQAEIESLVLTSNIYFYYICKDIGAAKCNVVAVLKGHLAEANDIGLSSGDLICHLSPTDTYKYLGILEADNF